MKPDRQNGETYESSQLIHQTLPAGDFPGDRLVNLDRHEFSGCASRARLVTSSDYLPEVSDAIRQVFKATRDGRPLQP